MPAEIMLLGISAGISRMNFGSVVEVCAFAAFFCEFFVESDLVLEFVAH